MEKEFLFRSKDIYKKAVDLRKEIRWTLGGIAITLLAAVFVFKDSFEIISKQSWNASSAMLLLEQAIFLAIVFWLIYGNLLYQITRIGYFKRVIRHRPVYGCK